MIRGLPWLPGLLCLGSAELVLPCSLPCFALPRPPASLIREVAFGHLHKGGQPPSGATACPSPRPCPEENKGATVSLSDSSSAEALDAEACAEKLPTLEITCRPQAADRIPKRPQLEITHNSFNSAICNEGFVHFCQNCN